MGNFRILCWEYSLKFRPENWPKIYGIGTSNKLVPGMAIEHVKCYLSGYRTIVIYGYITLSSLSGYVHN